MLPLGLSQSKQPKQWQQQTTQARKSPDFATSTPRELLSWQLNPFPVTVADCLIRVASGHVKIMCDVSVCPCSQMTIARPCSTLFSIRTNRTWIFWSVEFRCDRPDLRPSTRTALSTRQRTHTSKPLPDFGRWVHVAVQRGSWDTGKTYTMFYTNFVPTCGSWFPNASLSQLLRGAIIERKRLRTT